MFGFSVQKLMVLVGIIVAVWYGFRLVNQLAANRKGGTRLKGGARMADAMRRRWPGRKRPAPREVEDMVQCPVCGTFVSRDSGGCERGDCPY